MATFQTAYAKGIDAIDELCLAMGQPTVSSQLAQVPVLQGQLDTMTADRDTQLLAKNAKQAAITGMLADLATESADDALGDAARNAAIAKGQAA